MQEVVQKYKPTMLLGMTGVGGLFNEGIIKEMAKHCDRPVIFPLSNPTIKAECTATQAFEWTNGQCIFASGSPFDPVTVDGKVFYPTQCNNSKYSKNNISNNKNNFYILLGVSHEKINKLLPLKPIIIVYIFPGLGLGATLAGAKRVSDKMLYVAAEALANFVTSEDHQQGKVFPPLDQIRDVSKCVAIAVIKQAIKEGQAAKLVDLNISDWDQFVTKKMYDPVYVPLVEKREITI